MSPRVTRTSVASARKKSPTKTTTTKSSPTKATPRKTPAKQTKGGRKSNEQDPQSEVFDVEKIIDKREGSNGFEYYVKWLGWPPSANTWEPAANIAHLPEVIEEFEKESKKSSSSQASSKKRVALKVDNDELSDVDLSIYDFVDSADDSPRKRRATGTPKKSPRSAVKPVAMSSGLKFSPSPETKPAKRMPKIKTPAKSKLKSVDTSFDQSELDLHQVDSLKCINSSPVSITYLGELLGKQIIIQYQRLGFDEEDTSKLLSDPNTDMIQDFKNDIYANYMVIPSVSLKELNTLKAEVVYPADETAIGKYSRGKYILFQESESDYNKIVLPFIKKVCANKETLNWLHNILSGKSEKDRVLFNDSKNKDTGFILIPSNKSTEHHPHLLAICRRTDIRSIRDLNKSHLSLLKNIESKSMQAIKKKYKDIQFRSYVHYQPTFYHFHVHFEPLLEGPSGSHRDNLLTTIINNIELCEDYYQKSTLTYPLSSEAKLFEALQTAKRV